MKTDNAPALEAAEAEPVTVPKKPAESTAVSTPMALLLLGDDLRAIERRLATWMETEPSESRRLRLRFLQEVLRRAMDNYGQIDGELIRKALEARAVPTAEEVLADFSMIYQLFPVSKFSAEVERAFARLRRCIESAREQPDA